MGVVGIDYGLTETGFITRTTQDILAQYRGDLQNTFGASFDVGDSSVAGVVCGSIAGTLGELWEVAEQSAEVIDRDAASGPALDGVGALTGALRQAATKSTVTGTVTGTPDTPIDDSFQAATASTGATFIVVPSASFVIAACPAWQAGTAYTVGQRVTNIDRVFLCVASGTSSFFGVGPNSQSFSIPDGTGALVWAWIGDGSGSVDVPMQAVDAGIVIAVARDLTVPRTPIGGVQNVTNLTDALPGVAVESDPAYRIRQVEQLGGSGAGTAATIQALIIDAGAKACIVFNNDTDTTNSDGVPPHAFETLVEGLDDNTIANIISTQLPLGIKSFGSTTVTLTDSTGTTFPISFSRPTAIPVYVDVTLLMVAASYEGDPAAKLAIVTYADNQQAIGKDAVPSSLGGSVLPVIVAGSQVAGVAGVFKIVRTLAFVDVIGTPITWTPTTAFVATVGARSVVTNDGGRVYICVTGGTSGSTGPTGTGQAITDGSVVWWFLGNDIAISLRQLAGIDTSRIAIHSSAGVP